MLKKWRLVNGKELYNIDDDLFQQNNLAEQRSDIVESLLLENDTFLKNVKKNIEYQELPVHIIGNENQKEIKLTIQHAVGEGRGIWKSQHIAAGMKSPNNTHAIQVDRSGEYEILCCRWPKECPGAIWGVPCKNPKNLYKYNSIKPQKVRISIANQIHEKAIRGDEKVIAFKVNLQEGKTLLVNDFIEKNEIYGVYYTYIRFLGDSK